MSNPSINRWGLNLFWYRHWYNDRVNQSYIQQDVILEKLLYTYILYGILMAHHPFYNTRWYPTTLESSISNMIFYNERYYRNIEMKNAFFNNVVTICLRIRIKHFYFSKIWILRFQNWIVFNFYGFQPLKKKTLKKKTRFKGINAFKIVAKSNPRHLLNLKLLFTSISIFSPSRILKSYQF